MQTYNDSARKYLESQRTFFGLNDLAKTEFDHLVSLAASVMMTRDSVMMGGGFVQSIIDNNLSEAIGRADNTALKGLKALVMTKMWCHLKE